MDLNFDAYMFGSRRIDALLTLFQIRLTHLYKQYVNRVVCTSVCHKKLNQHIVIIAKWRKQCSTRTGPCLLTSIKFISYQQKKNELERPFLSENVNQAVLFTLLLKRIFIFRRVKQLDR